MEKKRVWRQFCEWLSEAVAHLPPAVAHLQTAGCLLLSACCCWRLYYADLRSELNTHLAAATSFPLSKHTGGSDTAPVFSGLHVYLQFTWEVGLSPSPVEFSSHYHFYKLSRSWLLGVCRHSCLLQPACCGGFPFPTSSALRVPHPLCYVSFLLLLLIIQGFFLFSLGGGRSVQGAMLIWPRFVCGSTMCHLAPLVVRIFPSHLGAAIWQRRGNPPSFSI
jgi:hypothetical protein